jgi:hypothetical protein
MSKLIIYDPANKHLALSMDGVRLLALQWRAFRTPLVSVVPQVHNRRPVRQLTDTCVHCIKPEKSLRKSAPEVLVQWYVLYDPSTVHLREQGKREEYVQKSNRWQCKSATLLVDDGASLGSINFVQSVGPSFNRSDRERNQPVSCVQSPKSIPYTSATRTLECWTATASCCR